MAVQLTIPYETLVALVEQLPADERRDLLHQLQEWAGRQALTEREWRAAFQSLILDRPLFGPIPLQRAEWYDDDEW